MRDINCLNLVFSKLIFDGAKISINCKLYNSNSQKSSFKFTKTLILYIFTPLLGCTPNATFLELVELQFVPNTVNYIIKDPATIFEAISRIDKTLSRADCVEFRVAEQSFEDKKMGLYRIYVKVVKDADDIEIRPDCIEVPYVVSVEPEYSKGYAASNTPIYINFNKDLETSNILNKITMSLSSGDTSIFNCFEVPFLSEDKTTVIIEPKPKQLKDYIEKELKTSSVELYINIEDGVIFKQEDIELPLSDIGGKNFKLRYKSEMEQVAPVRTDFL